MQWRNPAHETLGRDTRGPETSDREATGEPGAIESPGGGSIVLEDGCFLVSGGLPASG